MPRKTVFVAGSGPAGLAAAYNAALNGCRVTIFEQMPRPGLKLLASGGNKCNVTNTLELEDFARKFGKNWRFLLPALKCFHGRTLLDFFSTNGVELVREDGFHYFPASGKSSDVLNMWLENLARLKVEIKTSARISRIITDDNAVTGVEVSGRVYNCDALILACGGKSYPALGGLGTGYRLAEQVNHPVTELFPAMTGICVNDNWVHDCAGISLNDAAVFIDLKHERKNVERGELLFTKTGFSAFAVLDLAGRVSQLLAQMPQVPLVVDFLPDMSEDELKALFSNWHSSRGKKSVTSLLSEIFPRKLASYLLNGTDCPASQFKSSDAAQLVTRIKKYPFNATGTGSWDKAMVTLGGVSLKNINPNTLESRLVKNLFFSGELLDVTGPCGGFNITWALASGTLAGKCVGSEE